MFMMFDNGSMMMVDLMLNDDYSQIHDASQWLVKKMPSLNDGA